LIQCARLYKEMNSASPQKFSSGRIGNIGFVMVVVAAYCSAISALAYGRRTFTLPEITLIIALCVAYLLVGTVGFARCRRAKTSSAVITYFAVQLLLGITIIQLTRGGLIWMLLLPLAGQSVILLPRRWVPAFCALLVSIVVVPIGWSGSWVAASVLGVIFLAAVIFVVVSTQIAVNEQKARGEVERLAAELGEANRRLRKYAVQAEELATAKERNRLAREIHDSLGHYLTVINVQIEAARTVMETDRPSALDALRKAQSLAKEGLADVRRSIAALRATPTDTRPLPEAVAALVEENRAAGISTELTIMGEPRPLTPQTDLTLYRAAQEGLTNVRRHAQASRASLTIDYRDERIMRLLLQDDGVGSNETGGGFGLLGVLERAQLLGGGSRITTAPGEGFTLEVEIPS
jgi:signal transduction histidine kinase